MSASSESFELPRFTNRLANEKSPYLLQHAHNPVDWYPWGPEAFDRARAENKPVFLSVGYSACHWCHVMERESFENDAIAQVINAHFVAVKVDREERPDVDEVYMTAVQMMTGHGGWPMSMFLLPDGRPFYGGTYFPPESRGNHIGFRSLLEQLSDAYHHRRAEVEQIADSMATELQTATRQRPVAAPASGTLSPSALLRGAVADLAERFDAANGGFGGAPKFPPHHALRLLCEALRRGDNNAQPLLTTTLDRMALGGIYDHFGGGFHRYATDAVWLVPHFEKMLYDNALLARVYADAFTVTGNNAYARIARETCDWVLRDLADAGGGFHAALDADSEGVEGKYYVWTPRETAAVLGAAPAALFDTQYHLAPEGNFADEASGHLTGASIPYRGLGESGLALPAALDAPTMAAREALLAQRYGRIPPGKDDKVITAWNGLMIGALAFAGRVLDEERYTAAARRAADFCLTVLRPDKETLLRRYAKGEAAFPAYLDDHAFLADGLLDLYDATGDASFLTEARSLMDVLLRRFWDAEDSGFFYTGAGHESLIATTKDLFDGALPSANGVAARVLVRLGNLPDGAAYAERGQQMLHAFFGLMARAPQGTPTLILAAQEGLRESFPPALVSLHTEPNTLTIERGTRSRAVFILTVAPGYHVNASEPRDETLLPTQATMTTNLSAAVGPIQYPSAQEWQGDDGTWLSVYRGSVPFVVPIDVPIEAKPGTYRLTLTVRYQACSETECLAPAETTASAAITVP